MKKLHFLTTAVILLCFASFQLAGSGSPEKYTGEFIEGVLSLTGNEPHTEMILRTSDRIVYKLKGQNITELKKEGLGKKVRLYGETQQTSEGTFGPQVFIVTHWQFL